MKKYDFGIFGDDKRQVYMGKMLSDLGFRVGYYGIPKEEGGQVSAAASFFDLLLESEVLLGPIPLQKYLSLQEREALECEMRQGKRLVAGCIPRELKKAGYHVYDYMDDETLTVYNSIATAEGALAEALRLATGNISGSCCLVIGFGVCGKTLADRLQGLKAQVHVCARRESVLAEVDAYGYRGLSFSQLKEKINGMDFIFNTVPALIIGREELAAVKQEGTIIDIASAPGGVDFDSAKKLGVKAKLCPGLPGIYAPRASAEAMMRFVKKSIEIRGSE